MCCPLGLALFNPSQGINSLFHIYEPDQQCWYVEILVAKALHFDVKKSTIWVKNRM
jgi:hypothetical protein